MQCCRSGVGFWAQHFHAADTWCYLHMARNIACNVAPSVRAFGRSPQELIWYSVMGVYSIPAELLYLWSSWHFQIVNIRQTRYVIIYTIF